MVFYSNIQLQPESSALLYFTIENSIPLFFAAAVRRKEEISRKTSSLVRPVSANVENKRETPGSANLPYASKAFSDIVIILES